MGTHTGQVIGISVYPVRLSKGLVSGLCLQGKVTNAGAVTSD